MNTKTEGLLQVEKKGREPPAQERRQGHGAVFVATVGGAQEQAGWDCGGRTALTKMYLSFSPTVLLANAV